MKVTIDDHKAFVAFMFPNGDWEFDHYSEKKRASYWKASDGGKGKMNFTDGWVANWMRQQKRVTS